MNTKLVLPALLGLVACNSPNGPAATSDPSAEAAVGNDTATPAAAASPTDESSPTVGVSPAPAATGDNVEAIRFPPGGTAVTLAGALDAAGDKRYRFRASAGQPARITLREANEALAFNLYAPDSGPGGVALFRGSRAGKRYAATLPATGSYLVQVYRMNPAAGPDRAPFRLAVAIERADADAGMNGLSGSPAADPVAAIATYYRAIDRGDYAAAYRQWENGGQASGQSLAAFRSGFTDTRSTSVTPGKPRDREGAAGSLYVTVPVDVRATLRSGAAQHFTGSYVLRRVNDVPGSSAEERRWHLHSASLKPVR